MHPVNSNQQPSPAAVVVNAVTQVADDMSSSSGSPSLSGVGDSVSSSSQQGASTSLPSLDGIDIHDPIELLYFIDEVPPSGLHKWQLEFMRDFALSTHTKDHPFQAEVRACNGSGKDRYIVAACAIWLALAHKAARCVITNGSGVQLDNQTEAYIERLAKKCNSTFGGEIFKCNYRYYECVLTGSPIVLFATDEPNKAEGFHPLIPGGKMAIFASEAKAIPDEIFTALTRCTGYTHRVDVSTPGIPVGYFHDRCSTSIKRSSLRDIKAVSPTDCIEYHVTAFDCPHITKAEIDNFANSLAGGVNSPIYKSGILAEFGTTDELVVIPYTYVWQSITEKTQPRWLSSKFNTAGLDLSDGGDETVLCVRNGNKLLRVIPFRFDNTEDTVMFLNEKFKECELTNPEALIFADCGGLGKPILDRLRGMGWKNIRYVDNRHAPYYPRTYLNRGTEVWFHTRLLLERRELILLNDKVLIGQLSARYYKINQKNQHQLLSKVEQKSRGYKSPDRADAVVLAFWNYKSTKPSDAIDSLPPEEQEKKKPFNYTVTPPKPTPIFTQREWANGGGKQSLTQFKRSLRKQQDTSYLQEQLDQINQQRKETIQHE